MISNIFIALIGMLGTLGAVFLTNYLVERKERILKIEKEKDLKRIANTDLSNAQIELINNIERIKGLLLLYKIGAYDYSRMINQVNKITMVEITKFNNNIFLNKKQRSLAREMYVIRSIKEKFELTLDLYNHKIISHGLIKTAIDLSIEKLEKTEKTSYRLLKK